MADVLLALAAGAAALACGALAPVRRGLAGLVVLAAGLALTGTSVVPLLLITLAPWTAGRLVRSRRRLVTALAERNRALEAERAALAELAVREERARIARELHDIVAHHLAVMVIQAGAGRLDAPGGAARFAGIAETGREALSELDHLVELLAAERPRDLDALVAQARAAGLRLGYAPAPDGLPPAVRDVAYRVVQEGLTNAFKHAAGSQVRVRVGVAAGAAEVEVHDTGPTASSSLAGAGAGVGLAGMRERVEAAGGTLDAGPQPDGGWRLLARLPLRDTPMG